jgi:hypothetical protein
MEQLFREGLLRLSGHSDQAVFELNQAMGGGKTHLMIALGLLARHPHLRSEILPSELADRLQFGSARIAAFNGRNDPEHFIWGEIATQLGAGEAIKPYWANGPRAVDQAAWKALIGDHPTLILLDELPPYLDNASTRVIGEGTLATLVTYSLGTLMSAALELPHCAIVIANLSGSYTAQTKALKHSLSNLQQENRRQAVTITPVQLAGNEIYEILKKRLIDELPGEAVIAEVAEEYAQQIKKAEDGGYIVAASLEQIAEQVRETYPFHPAFKYLAALFKENEGFRQTRGLMQFTARLLKSIDQRPSDDVFLIGTQHLDLNDDQVRDEIERIAPKLGPAVSHDMADNGNAIAEMLDADRDNDAARQVMTLLLSASLSRAVGGRIGLSEGEMIEFLAAPNRKPDEFLDALQRLREQAWYLHREDQRYFIKETENLSRQIERHAKEVPQPKIDHALINRLLGILQPQRRQAYQDLKVLPRLDGIRLSGPRVLMVIRPDGRVPPSELNHFFTFQQDKNNLLVLTGQDSYLADAVEGCSQPGENQSGVAVDAGERGVGCAENRGIETKFALRPRRKGETTVVDEIVQQAAEAANSLLIPDGLDAAIWQRISGIQRFYLRMLDMETTGASKLDNYQNFAKAFRVQDYSRVMASMTANRARLKRVTEFASRDLTDSTELGATWLGRLIIGLQQLLADTEPQIIISQLQAELPDFMEVRPLLIGLLDFLATKTPEPAVRAAAEILGARLKNMRALNQ